MIAVAPGRITVSDRTQLVQSFEAGVVEALHVRDGDRVVAGQVLVELDGTSVVADRRSVEEQFRSAREEAERARALMQALRAGRLVLQADAAAVAAARIEAEWADHLARLSRLDAETARKRAELGTVREVIAKLETTLPLVRQREADFEALSRQGFVAIHAGQDRVRERVEIESDLATQRARELEVTASLSESHQAREAYKAEFRRVLADRLGKAEDQLRLLAQDQVKTLRREQFARLVAPVSGTVQQLSVRGVGSVVSSAQTLLVVVPADAPVTAEVVIQNKDIGFVHAGQAVEIKVETFSFTRYGTLAGTVSWVAADAVQDEKRGAIFPATIRLAASTLDVDGKQVGLTPGMQISAEIKTGRRRVIDYLLSPLRQVTHESMRER